MFFKNISQKLNFALVCKVGLQLYSPILFWDYPATLLPSQWIDHQKSIETLKVGKSSK